MEVLFILVVIVVCIIVATKLGKNGKSSTASRVTASPSKLVIRSRQTQKIIDDVAIQLLVFEVSNLLVIGPQKSSCLRLRMSDETNGEKHPVLSAFEQLQMPDSAIFQSIETLPTVPRDKIFHLDEFQQFCAVPIDGLIFPRSGNRTIRACLELVEGNQVSERAEALFQVPNNILGYMDGAENMERSQELGIYLALHLAAADGHLGKAEAETVKKWVAGILEATEPEGKEKRRERLNFILKDAYEKAMTTGLKVLEIASELESIATTPIKYEVIELCMNVMSTDGSADPAELRELEGIANQIGLDSARYRALLDRRLADVETVHGGTQGDLASLLGITPGMDKEEIKKTLNKEYRKWNARVSSDDPAIRKRAEQMVEHIAEVRKKSI